MLSYLQDANKSCAKEKDWMKENELCQISVLELRISETRKVDIQLAIPSEVFAQMWTNLSRTCNYT